MSGCTDKDSVNYNATANEDDGSCSYQGKVVLWYDQATSQTLINNGVTGLVYYIDNTLVGSSVANFYFTSQPDCASAGATVVTYNMGISKSLGRTLIVKDQSGNTITTNTITFIANSCTAYKL